MDMRWSGFRRVRRQVCKRLSRRLRELGLRSLDEYRVHLDAHPAEWDVLDGLCRITVSRFYRDRAVFDVIRDRILPTLARATQLRDDPVIRCWSAGCASGEEPYGLSLAWDLEVAAAVPGADLRIVATDADAHLLERARMAAYPRGTLKELPDEWIAVAFERADDELRLHPSYRDRVELLRLGRSLDIERRCSPSSATPLPAPVPHLRGASSRCNGRPPVPSRLPRTLPVPHPLEPQIRDPTRLDDERLDASVRRVDGSQP